MNMNMNSTSLRPSTQQQQQQHLTAETGSNTASTSTPTSANNNDTRQQVNALTDEAVLAYLRQRGFGHAAAELNKILTQERREAVEVGNDTKSDVNHYQDDALKPIDLELELEPMEESFRAGKQQLGKAMGKSGGMGYDLDATPGILGWGVNHTNSSSRRDVNLNVAPEARQYFTAFSVLQTYVNSLPDYEEEDDNGIEAGKDRSNGRSCKAELSAVCFPLLVHIYCDVMEMGYEGEARAFLQSWRGAYEDEHGIEMKDLDKCDSKDKVTALHDMVRFFNLRILHNAS